MYGMNRMFDNDPFFADFREQQRRMDAMFNNFGFGSMFAAPDPFNAVTDGNRMGAQQERDRSMRERDRHRVGAMAPFGMFPSMHGMMMDMHTNFDRMASDPNCHTFSQSSVMTYSNTGNGAPKVFQASSSSRTAPGGIKETRKAVRDSESGIDKMSIGHHIYDRGQVVGKSKNRRTGDEEEHQELLNMDETDVAAFGQEWREKTHRHSNPAVRSRPRESRQSAITDGREHRAHRSRSPPRPQEPRKKSKKHHQDS